MFLIYKLNDRVVLTSSDKDDEVEENSTEASAEDLAFLLYFKKDQKPKMIRKEEQYHLEKEWKEEHKQLFDSIDSRPQSTSLNSTESEKNRYKHMYDVWGGK